MILLRTIRSFLYPDGKENFFIQKINTLAHLSYGLMVLDVILAFCLAPSLEMSPSSFSLLGLILILIIIVILFILTKREDYY